MAEEEGKAKNYLKEEIGKLEKKFEETVEKIIGHKEEEIRTGPSGWDRFRAKFKQFLGWVGVIIALVFFALIGFVAWLVGQVKKVPEKIPELPTEVIPKEMPEFWWIVVLAAVIVIPLVYLANKWKDEPETIGKEPEEKKAEVKKLIAFLIMLILGSVLLGVAAQLYAVNFQGINLTKSLFFLFIAVGLANLILQPGTGTALVKTFIFCSCLVIGISVYGIYKGWQPIPKEKRLVAGIKEQSCQAELAVPMQKIEEIKTLLKTKISVEKRRELIGELKEEEEKCKDIRKFYGIQGRNKSLISLKQKYKMEFSPDREDVEKNLKRVGIDTAEEYWREFKTEIGYGQTARLVSVQENKYTYRSGELIPGKTPVIFEGVWNEQNQTYQGEWKKIKFLSAKKEKLIATGGFELEFINGIGKGWWWLRKSPKKYALKFY